MGNCRSKPEYHVRIGEKTCGVFQFNLLFVQNAVRNGTVFIRRYKVKQAIHFKKIIILETSK